MAKPKQSNFIPKVRKIFLTKAEVDSLKEFSDNNLCTGNIEVYQYSEGGIGFVTKVQVRDLPETLMDITDLDSW